MAAALFLRLGVREDVGWAVVARPSRAFLRGPKHLLPKGEARGVFPLWIDDVAFLASRSPLRDMFNNALGGLCVLMAAAERSLYALGAPARALPYKIEIPSHLFEKVPRAKHDCSCVWSKNVGRWAVINGQIPLRFGDIAHAYAWPCFNGAIAAVATNLRFLAWHFARV
eukprot:gnl/Chilomastix_cuspidata/4338.p3 GENE.gnl/Chilomastix_cuspidata/4338~~gnl/Chilomastix_cuspidata/4338.p3  ORF type:complete len:169 (+),score=76.99 gnl/Chilomastix_cuspidata/4338:755-1261(+)